MRTLPGDALLDEPDELEPPPADGSDGDGSARPPLSDATRSSIEKAIDGLVVAAAVLFVLAQLGPRNILRDTTPAGGDMGAHVWGPIYLRDHLLPSLRLNGWTPDWYDGFPVFRFYMVVPALAIVLLDSGIHGWWAIVPAIVAGALGAAAVRRARHSRDRRLLATAAVLVAVLGIGVPYGIAFKLVAVSGIVALPAAAYAFGRLAGLAFPTPAMLSAASLLFVFNREPTSNGTGNIIGGNATSTLAGEYSFSIALSLGLVFLGLVIDGLRTGRRRPLAAVVLALTLTCHLIVGLFVIGAALLAWLIWPGRARLRWLVPVGGVGALLASFWFLPFLVGHAYVNDMGWEKSPGAIAGRGWTAMLTDPAIRDSVIHDYLLPSGLYPVLAFAAVGISTSVLLRNRVGWWLTAVTAAMAVGFVVCPEDRLWNARLLPFYYLTLCLLAAVGLAEVLRAVALLVARDPARPSFGVTAAAPVAGGLIALVLVGLPLQSLPGESSSPGANGKTEFSWGPLNLSMESNPAKSWAMWNFSGYERKASYPEFHDLVVTMQKVATTDGCGRAMWEYEGDRLNLYGTPMAPMLLPLFTDGCIGSMEGLYFESSMTTPFHFLNQSELSTACSCAQRNLPYKGFDIDLGIKHMQLLGVRYYLASTAAAVDAAQHHPDLTEIASSGPWHVFRIAGSELVAPLTNEPAVVRTDNAGLAWVYGDGSPHSSLVKANGPAVSWYLDPSKWNVMLAADGPSEWQRVDRDGTPDARPLPPVEVTSVGTTDDTVEFDVDRTGVPVLVKVSYFPSWVADGARGPWRVAPNLMVVIPTSNHVRLRYARTAVDYGADALTLAGIAGVALLARRRDVEVPEPDEPLGWVRPLPDVDGDDDDDDGDDLGEADAAAGDAAAADEDEAGPEPPAAGD